MKVSVIGGGGLVGSSTAFALQTGGIVSEIALIDVNGDLCRGQALDLLHGSALVADQRITASDYSAIPTSDMIVITAGLRRKPDESRLDLINRNVELFLDILEKLTAGGLRRDAILVVVSNPVDVLTYLAIRKTGLPAKQVIGLGTLLDTSRFRGLLAEALALPPTQVTATILGEHGDSMVPIWSAAQAGGMPLDKFPGFTPTLAESIFERTKGSGAEVIKLKGGAGFAVGIAIRELVHAIVLDQRRILPVSTLMEGVYDIKDVCLSVPTTLGAGGSLRQLEIDLWPKELAALRKSGEVLRRTIEQVFERNPKAREAGAPARANAPVSAGGPRVTFGAGGSAGRSLR